MKDEGKSEVEETHTKNWGMSDETGEAAHAIRQRK